VIREPLCAPGTGGAFDSDTGLLHLGFNPTSLGSIFEPTQSNWRQLVTLYHEWVHFYQHHATTYGYLHRMLSNAQLLLGNGFLRVAREERGRRRQRLPLTVGSTALDLDGVSPENPNAFNRRALAMIQQTRDGISGFGPFPTLSSMAEWRLLGLVLDEMFGIPPVFLSEPAMPSPPFIRYKRVHYLLETHAHLLSTAWLSMAVERSGGDPRISQAAAEVANEQAKGPYAAFLKFADGLPVSGTGWLKVFCALAEIACNPPGVHRHPRQSWDTTIVPLYTSWFPVVRMETLMSLATEGKVSWPQSRWPDVCTDLLTATAKAVGVGFQPAADGATAEHVLERALDRLLRYDEDPADVVPALLDYVLDGHARLLAAERLKRASPLLLSGFGIFELEHLVGSLGGPSGTFTHGGDARTIVGACAGLLHAGLIGTDRVMETSDEILFTALPLVRTLQLLMHRTRHDLEQIADDRLIGQNNWTLRAVLAEHYGLALGDFD
jgi:hypothetical protein